MEHHLAHLPGHFGRATPRPPPMASTSALLKLRWYSTQLRTTRHLPTFEDHIFAFSHGLTALEVSTVATGLEIDDAALPRQPAR